MDQNERRMRRSVVNRLITAMQVEAGAREVYGSQVLYLFYVLSLHIFA